MRSMNLSQAANQVNGRLSGQNLRFTTVSTDSRGLPSGALFVALQGPHFDGHKFVSVARERGACAALVSRPVDLDLPQIQVDDTRLALGRLAAAWRQDFQGPLLALTASNGKTTMKEMLGSILGCRGPVLVTQGNLNNDIGVPLTLLRLQSQHRYAVIEMGANHPGEIAYLTGLARPDVALLGNAGPAHLEGFGDLDGVAQAKGEIFQGLAPAGVAVINADDTYADYWLNLLGKQRILDFGLQAQTQIGAQIINATKQQIRLRLEDQTVDVRLPLTGRHNVYNALAAAAASFAVGASLENIRLGLESMVPVAGRLQTQMGRSGVTVINDTYNANPASLAAALDAVMGAHRWLVLGDMAELGANAEQFHEQAGYQARSAGFERLYGLGDYSRLAVQAFGSKALHFQNIEDLNQTLIEALSETVEQPVVLIKGSRGMRMERVVRTLVSTEGAH